ncbi:MAG: DUF4358 domain-containing protein [Oscillospiraceae bacterium]|jgi:hypothetical protein|nr:DUF4358 domain-containing protein [Oscillospiraceae bacterium]
MNMKKVFRLLALALALTAALALAACAQKETAKNPKVSDVMAKVRDGISFPEMAEKTIEDLAFYGYDQLDPAKVEEAAFIIASSGLTPEEVFIVKLTDAAGAEEVQKLMEARRDQIAATSQDYTPELMDQIEGAVIGAKGVYAYFAITNDNDQAEQIFDEQF